MQDCFWSLVVGWGLQPSPASEALGEVALAHLVVAALVVARFTHLLVAVAE